MVWIEVFAGYRFRDLVMRFSLRKVEFAVYGLEGLGVLGLGVLGLGLPD